MHDLRDAFRSLKSTPVVSLVAVLSLALGIGANSAIFSILDSLILRALPVRAPEQLASLGDTRPAGRTSWTNPIWEQIRDQQARFGGAFAWQSTRFNLARGGQTEMVDGLWASGGIFDTLGVSAMLGRTFTAADDARGGGPDGPVAVISYSFWQRRFDGAADVVGRTLVVDRVPFTIVGVTPPQFFGVDVGRRFDVVIPIGAEPLIRGKESYLDRRSTWWLRVMIRLKDGQTLSAGDAVLRGLLPQVREATVPQEWRPDAQARYLAEGLALRPAANGGSPLRRIYGRPLTTIMVVVALVLLIACANIANLLLARATARRQELSIRVALGASRWRIARQLLAESLMLSTAGALLGLGLAQWGSRLLVRQLSTSNNAVFLSLALDWRVLGFTAAVATATALLFGMAPALRGTRVQPNDALKAQGRGVVGDGRFGLGSALVVLQVALSLVLVVAAGLFMRTFSSLASLPLGFDSGPVLVANLNAQALQLELEARPALFRRALDAAVATPGVASAAISAVTPVSNNTWNNTIELPDGPNLPGNERLTYLNLVSENYFRTLGTPLLAGRDFTSQDTNGAPMVAIVNEAFAKKFAYGKNPIGVRIRQPGYGARPSVDRVIVGYVKDAVYESLRETPPPTMYMPLEQQSETPSEMSVSVRAAAGSASLLARPLAASLTRVHSDVAITLRPLSDYVGASLVQERLVAGLGGFFGGLALLLAGLGLYGVTSYAVSRRRTEIGIRMALGAQPGGVVAMVLHRVAILVGVGTVVGVAAALWASKFVATLLYGLQPRDPATMIAAVLVLATIGAAAGWLPARRASRIDPAKVLRDG
jgi:putative ABC transport system permease protein